MELEWVRLATGLLGLPGAGIWEWLGSRSAVFVYALLVLAWIFQQSPRKLLLVTVLLAVIGSDLLCGQVLKPLFQRIRPCNVANLDVPRCSSSYAMPSGHASNTMAIAVALSSPPLGILSVGVGISRIVLGMHYPSDVGVGWGIGAMIGGLARWGAARWKSKPSS